MPGRFYITTPIYYPNDRPHMGHAYTTVYADVLARYHRLVGDDTFFLTGTDEHGLKLQRAAEKEGITPKEFVDRMAEIYKRYWRTLNISYDRFIRTTDPDHEEVVKYALTTLHKKGLVYKDVYAGWYCVSCERFYRASEYEVIDGEPHCPIHKKPLEWVEEETYYFKLSEFKEFLVDVLENKEIVYPRDYAREVLGRIRAEGLVDISMARPKDRVSWGIQLPFDPDFTVYVWFDALLNYVTGAGYLHDEERFRRYWPVVHHVIGKDILWFHTVIWFSMLKALDIPLPKKVVVHAFITSRGLKMGKSAGNVVRIEDLLERYGGADGARYILMRYFSHLKDIDVSVETLDAAYNSELADTYGNLVRRVGVLAKKKLGGRVAGRADESLGKVAEEAVRNYASAMESFDVSTAITAAMDLLREANAYMNATKPWERDDPSNELYSVIEAVRLGTAMLYPIIPGKAEEVAKALGFGIVNPLEKGYGEWETYNVVSAPILFRKVSK